MGERRKEKGKKEREKEKDSETERHRVVRLVTELLPLGGFIDRRVRSGPIYPSCNVRHACWYLLEPVRLLASLPDSPLLRQSSPKSAPPPPPDPIKCRMARYLDQKYHTGLCCRDHRLECCRYRKESRSTTSRGRRRSFN